MTGPGPGEARHRVRDALGSLYSRTARSLHRAPLAGRQVVVTGASSGIGRETTRALAAGGATVVAVGRDPTELATTARGDPRIIPRIADLATPEGQAAVFEGLDGIDALVNDAGLGWVGLVEDMPLEEIDRMIAVNVAAVLRLTRLALGQLRPGGHIINIGSSLGRVATPPLTVYSATKFAVHGFSEGLRREVAGRGLYVTEITPGPIKSHFFSRATSRPGAASVPGFPMAPPERVANAVCRALEHPGWPGYRTVSAPRWAALARLGALPGANRLTDAVAAVTRSAAVLRPGGRGGG